MLPISLLPAARPVETLMGMSEREFLDLYVGDGCGRDSDEPDAAVIDAFDALVDERTEILVPQWLHRDAVADLVSCFAPLASDVSFLDIAIQETSRWLSANGTRTALRSLGVDYETAEALAHSMVEAACEGAATQEELDRAADAAGRLAETCMLHLAFGDVWVQLTLLADRIRVTVDLPEEGEVDMGGHHWGGDDDRDAAVRPDPVLVA